MIDINIKEVHSTEIKSFFEVKINKSISKCSDGIDCLMEIAKALGINIEEIKYSLE